MPWTPLCPLADLIEGKAKYIEAAGLHLAVFLHQGQPHVIDNYCPHAGGSLSAGYIEDGCAVCPWHNWPFDLNTGHLKGSTAVTIAVYPARIEQQDNAAAVVEADL